MIDVFNQKPCPLCGHENWVEIIRYDRPPEGETRFPSFSGEHYCRSYERCQECGLFRGRLPIAISQLYSNEYMEATYGDRLRVTFDRIMSLPNEQSDNTQRVHDIIDFFAKWWRVHPRRDSSAPEALDVGAGLCVFLARLREFGWHCTALDPDPCALKHAREVVGVATLEGDFLQVPAERQFDLIAFNKVLEHVADPLALLQRSAEFLVPCGIVYVEVPDAEMAIREGAHREEFFIEHLWVFSASSLVLLAKKSRLMLQRLERLREPSGKYTLRAWLSVENTTLTGV